MRKKRGRANEWLCPLVNRCDIKNLLEDGTVIVLQQALGGVASQTTLAHACAGRTGAGSLLGVVVAEHAVVLGSMCHVTGETHDHVAARGNRIGGSISQSLTCNRSGQVVGGVGCVLTGIRDHVVGRMPQEGAAYAGAANAVAGERPIRAGRVEGAVTGGAEAAYALVRYKQGRIHADMASADITRGGCINMADAAGSTGENTGFAVVLVVAVGVNVLPTGCFVAVALQARDETIALGNLGAIMNTGNVLGRIFLAVPVVVMGTGDGRKAGTTCGSRFVKVVGTVGDQGVGSGIPYLVGVDDRGQQLVTSTVTTACTGAGELVERAARTENFVGAPAAVTMG